MSNLAHFDLISETIGRMASVHYSNGHLHQRVNKLKAQFCFEKNEIEAIYYLVESHMPSIRTKNILRYEKRLTPEAKSTKKKNLAFKCHASNLEDNIRELLERIEEMPEEWTLVQLTQEYEKENIIGDIKKHVTNSLFLSVFHCGKNQPKPFCLHIKAPNDPVTGKRMELAQEMYKLLETNRNILSTSSLKSRFLNVPEKQKYYDNRRSVDNQLKSLVRDISNLYLKEWKCLFMGKYVNSNLEKKIQDSIHEFFEVECPGIQPTEKQKCILQYLIKAYYYLKLVELKDAVQTIIPDDKKTQKLIVQFIRNTSIKLSLNEQKRHPVLLILDEGLDQFPWEMVGLLSDSLISRLPSVHIAYNLFKEHQPTIKNGSKIVKNPANGKYIVNPDKDLKNMQARILSFYEYWLPSWKGVHGCKPEDSEVMDLISSCEIFAYNGHGNGAHFFPLHLIEKIKMKSVALFFGCSSSKLNVLGPSVEMYGSFLIYLIACCPCIIGNIWEVTDLDTDVLTTYFLSIWIENSTLNHWQYIDKSVWKKGETVNIASENSVTGDSPHEPEILRALNMSKKLNHLSFYITKAGIVARGIPVKIEL